jgi:hypothetical protein
MFILFLTEEILEDIGLGIIGVISFIAVSSYYENVYSKPLIKYDIPEPVFGFGE